MSDPYHPRRLLPRRLDSGRDPFEVFVLALGLTSGIPILTGHNRPDPVMALLNPTLLWVWAVILTIGCAVALIGVFWPWKLHSGLLIEQLGLSAVGAGILIYTYALAALPGAERVLAMALAGGFGLACWWRVMQIQQWVRSVVTLAREKDSDR